MASAGLFLKHYLLVEVNEVNIYLAADLETRDAVLIDAGGFDPRIVEDAQANNLNVRAVLITHDHYDHTEGLHVYGEAFPEAEVVAGASVAGGQDVRAVVDGEIIEAGSMRLRALAMGGHSDDSTAYFLGQGEGSSAAGAFPLAPPIVFTGDSLFAGSIGGTVGEENQNLEIENIRKKFFSLPNETLLLPGHGPMTAVGVEKFENPFFS